MALTRRETLVTLLVGIAVLCTAQPGALEEQSTARGTAGAAARAAKARPNFIFILVDDLRFDLLGCTGHPFMKTPHIDRIAKEGANFKNGFVTTPLCSPSRASFLTGQYAHTHQIHGNGAANTGHKLKTFAIELQGAGYECGYVGKWHMGNDDSPRPGWNYWAGLRGQSVYTSPTVNVNGQVVRDPGYVTDILTSYAISFVSTPRNKPFCLYLGHKAIHGPFEPAPRHRDLYTTEPITRRPNVEDTLEGKPAFANFHKDQKRDPKKIFGDGLPRNQMRCLQSIDEGVGELYAALKKSGQLDNTLIIFTSDNGYQWGEHQLGDKRTAYEESLRVPLLMRYPKLFKPGTEPEEFALAVDIAPTILELAGLPIPKQVQGRSLVGAMQGQVDDWRKVSLFEYFEEKGFPKHATWQAVRSDRYKYIHYPLLNGMDELYDLFADPYEMQNLNGNPKAKPALKRMQKSLRKLLKDTDAPSTVAVLLREESTTLSITDEETSSASFHRKKNLPPRKKRITRPAE